MHGEDELVWYFAYGSNLDPGTFLGRRRMRPRESCTAILRGYRLVFDLPIGDGERGCANVLAAPDALIHGVAYRVTTAEAHRLDATEGVPRAYQRLDVELERDGGEPLAAFTYVSSFRRSERKPSERYLNLLLAGARHHGLPQEWIDWLRSQELAVDERTTQLELFAARARARRGEVEPPVPEWHHSTATEGVGRATTNAHVGTDLGPLRDPGSRDALRDRD